MFPSLRGRYDLAFTDPKDADLGGCDVVFFATPHGVAMAQARELVGGRRRGSSTSPPISGCRIRALFERWYKMPHACPDLLDEAVYGIPEINREAIRKARIVGNPGCYPTAVQLGFLPLIEAGLVDTRYLIADCKSGVSGAGRKAELSLVVRGGVGQLRRVRRRRAPSSARDRPGAEPARARTPVRLTFTPHLTPIIRGILATLYAPLTRTRRRPAGAVREALRAASRSST